LPATISLSDKWFSLNYKRTLEDGGDRMKRGGMGVGVAVLRKPATIETRIQTPKGGRRERKVSYLCAGEVVINYHQ
jgi:hypothetical protein